MKKEKFCSKCGSKLIKKGEQVSEELTNFFEELVPGSGPAETKEGELIRAINKIMYRYYNDGDYFDRDYGIETAGSSYMYLLKMSFNISGLNEALVNARGKIGKEYQNALSQIESILVSYVESKEGRYTKNTDDMLNYHGRAEEEFGRYEEGDYYS